MLEDPEFAVKFGVEVRPVPNPSDDALCARFAFQTSVPLILCHIDRVRVEFCGQFLMIPTDNESDGTLDPAFVLTDLSVETEVEVPVSGTNRPGCSPIHQNAVADGIRGALTDPEEGLEAKLSAALQDAMWQRGAAGLPLGEGCTSVPEPETLCLDALGLADLGGWRVRCDPAEGDEPETCSWNLEADRMEMLPSRLEIVLAHDESDPTVEAMREVLGMAGIDELCRTGAAETAIVSGELGWRASVLAE